MSTVQQEPTAIVSPLAGGQRLSQAEFVRRYEDTPRDFQAELIGGVVYVASPVGREHGRSSVDIITWLHSKVFPGLWLDPKALLNEDLKRVIATLGRGLDSPEHAHFIAQLAAVRDRNKG